MMNRDREVGRGEDAVDVVILSASISVPNDGWFSRSFRTPSPLKSPRERPVRRDAEREAALQRRDAVQLPAAEHCALLPVSSEKRQLPEPVRGEPVPDVEVGHRPLQLEIARVDRLAGAWTSEPLSIALPTV